MSALGPLADLLFVVGWRLLKPLHDRRRREMRALTKRPFRIIVVTPYVGVGNLVILTGLLANLRRLYPHAYLALAAPPAPHVRTVISDELADDILPFDPRSRRHGLWLAWQQLRPRAFDLGLVTFFLPTLYASCLLTLAGCRYRITFAADEQRGLLNTLTCIDRGGHELDRHLQLLTFADRAVERSTCLTANPEAVRWADATLSRLRLGERRKLLGVHPGCDRDNAQKRWPARRFGEVIRQLIASGDADVLLFVGPEEVDVVPSLVLPQSPRVHVVSGESLAHTIGLVAKCDVFLSNDSGLMHVAAALGVPVAAIFGPTPLEKNAPLGRAAILEERGLWCRPCWVGAPLVCHRDRRYCLEGITVDEVLRVTRALLQDSVDAGAEPRTA